MPEDAIGRSKHWYADARLIILAIFAAGLFLRLANLNAIPFSTAENQAAFAALSVAKGLPAGTAASPVYEGLTALSFLILRVSPFFARLWPALAGASLALVPLFWRRKVGQLTAVLLAAGFAFDPVLVTLSRQASGAIFTAVGLIWAISFYFEGKPVGFGSMLALAWLSSAWFWIAGLVGLLGLGILRLLRSNSVHHEYAVPYPKNSKGFWLAAGVSFCVSIVLVSSAFFLNPTGLSGLGAGLSQLWQTNVSGIDISPITSIYRLAAYSLPMLALAFPAALSAWKEKNDRLELFSLLAGLMLLSIVLAWQLGPAGFGLLHCLLWVLSAETLVRLVNLRPITRQAAWVAFLLGAVICAYLAISLKNLANPLQTGSTFGQSAIAFILGLLLLVLVFVLVMVVWSLDSARKGILGAVIFSLLAYCFSLSMLAIQTANPYPALVWSDSEVWLSAKTQSLLLEETVKLGKLEPQVSRVLITDPKLESLRWEFREYKQAELSSALPADNAPEVILSSTADQQGAALSYRGIHLLNPGSVAWGRISLAEFLRGAVNQSLPVEKSEYYLWVRQDLLTGAVP